MAASRDTLLHRASASMKVFRYSSMLHQWKTSKGTGAHIMSTCPPYPLGEKRIRGQVPILWAPVSLSPGRALGNQMMMVLWPCTAVQSAATEHAREHRVVSRLVVSRGELKPRCNSLEQFSQFSSVQSVGSQMILARGPQTLFNYYLCDRYQFNKIKH